MHADPFYIEYTSQDAILKYTKATAGAGISYLLDHDYKDVYVEALALLPAKMRQQGLRVLEFGCGAGMNLVHLTAMLGRAETPAEIALGTDFSPVLIEAANREAKSYLREEDRQKLQFYVAKNETLKSDLASGLGQPESELENSFHFIFGVNTIRYCHRANKAVDCARDILELLVPGGVCVVIDMNNRFPVFRSDLRNRFRRKKEEKEEECYLPSLEEYTAPFVQAGFEIVRSTHFCWIPHSASPTTCRVMRLLSPVLNTLARSRAMRSLVVCRKPASS